jgi:hypothetical protein
MGYGRATTVATSDSRIPTGSSPLAVLPPEQEENRSVPHRPRLRAWSCLRPPPCNPRAIPETVRTSPSSPTITDASAEVPRRERTIVFRKGAACRFLQVAEFWLTRSVSRTSLGDPEDGLLKRRLAVFSVSFSTLPGNSLIPPFLEVASCAGTQPFQERGMSVRHRPNSGRRTYGPSPAVRAGGVPVFRHWFRHPRAFARNAVMAR